MQQYGSDEIRLAFSTSANGRWITPFISAGPSWTFTLHGIPTNSGIRVEGNNSRYFQIGHEGIVNPIYFAIKSGNESVKATSTAIDGSFSGNWIEVKPSSEFNLLSNSGCVSCDTSIWPIQGQFRYLRLSMTATPSADTRAFYFDSTMTLKG